MEISVVFYSISLIAILIMIGAIAAKSYPFNNSTIQMFITLITNIGMPAIILSSVFSVNIDQDTLKIMMMIFIASITINIVGLILGFIATALFKKHSNKKIEVAILSAFGNTGFIGIPLCAVLFGPKGALYAAIFDAGVDFTIWTVGVFLLQKKRKFSLALLKDMINIPLLAIMLGLLIAAFGIEMPIMIIDITEMLATFAVPMAMFFIGGIIVNFQRNQVQISYFEIAVPVLIKLILLPGIVIITLINSGLSQLVFDVLIIQSMMPALTLSSVLFAKYSRDDKFGALITIISTLASLFIIPVLLFFVNNS